MATDTLADVQEILRTQLEELHERRAREAEEARQAQVRKLRLRLNDVRGNHTRAVETWRKKRTARDRAHATFSRAETALKHAAAAKGRTHRVLDETLAELRSLGEDAQ